jgi:hypothetical protein
VYNGSVLITFRVYKWALYVRLIRGLCTVYILSPGYPWDIGLSVLNFLFFMGPLFILQLHARKFCGQFTFLLMLIMLKSLFLFGGEVKNVWSYNFIFTVLVSKYFPEYPIDNATSCYMNRWQSADNGCSKDIIANNGGAETSRRNQVCMFTYVHENLWYCLHVDRFLFIYISPRWQGFQVDFTDSL